MSLFQTLQLCYIRLSIYLAALLLLIAFSKSAYGQTPVVDSGAQQAAPAPTPAPTDVPIDPLVVAKDVQSFRDAVKRGDFKLASSLALMAVVWFLRKLSSSDLMKNKPDALPWITLGIAMATGSLVSLGAGVDLADSLIAGALIGTSASGTWSLVGKHFNKFISTTVPGVAPVLPPPSQPPPQTDPPKAV